MTSAGADRRRRAGGPVRRHPLDLVTVEQLFAALDAPTEDRVEGVDGRWMPLVDTLRAAGAPATAGELAGEDAAISAFRAARASVSPQPRRSARRLRRTVALAVLLGAGVATSVAAASDHLPAPVERLANHLLGALGLADRQPSPSPTPPPAVPTTVVGTAPPATAPPATIAVTAPPSAAVAIDTPPMAPVPGLQPTPTEGAVAPDADAPRRHRRSPPPRLTSMRWAGNTPRTRTAGMEAPVRSTRPASRPPRPASRPPRPASRPPRPARPRTPLDTPPPHPGRRRSLRARPRPRPASQRHRPVSRRSHRGRPRPRPVRARHRRVRPRPPPPRISAVRRRRRKASRRTDHPASATRATGPSRRRTPPADAALGAPAGRSVGDAGGRLVEVSGRGRVRLAGVVLDVGLVDQGQLAVRR